MNIPTIRSTSGTSAGRPDTTVPNDTSIRPASRASTRAHAPCTIVLNVSPWPRAKSVSVRVDSADSHAQWSSGITIALPASASTTVGSSDPANSERHADRVASWS